MWSGHIHDAEFISKVLAEVDLNGSNYSTAPRMKGMLTVAGEVFQKYSPMFNILTKTLTGTPNAVLLHARKAFELFPMQYAFPRRTNVSSFPIVRVCPFHLCIAQPCYTLGIVFPVRMHALGR